MQKVIPHKSALDFLDESDEVGLELFNNLNPVDTPPQSPREHSPSPAPGRLSKMSRLQQSSKKSQKADKIKKKKKEGKSKSKKKKRLIKMKEAQQQMERLKEDQGSSEFESPSDRSAGLEDQLKALNPDLASEQKIKSNRKKKIEDKEGFRIQELGNDAVVESDSQWANKKTKRKERKPVVSNEEMIRRLGEHGVVDSEGEEPRGNYDSGIDTLSSLKQRKKGIRIANRLFGDLEVDLAGEHAHLPQPEDLQLELKPKTSLAAPSERFSFLSKAETIKKRRGMEAEVDQVKYQRQLQERAKKSIAKVVTHMMNQDYHEDLDLEIKVPTVARGKSADIINNTVFLRRSLADNSESRLQLLTSSSSITFQSQNRSEGYSRSQYFKKIQDENRMRRSKHISEQQLKNSFKKTNLEELEEARKKLQQKRRKQALSGSEQSISDSQQMLQEDQYILDQQKQNLEEGNIQIEIEELRAELAQPKYKQRQDSIGNQKNEQERREEQKQQVQAEFNEQEREEESPKDQNEEEINEQRQLIYELREASSIVEDVVEQEEQQSSEEVEENEVLDEQVNQGMEEEANKDMELINQKIDREMKQLAEDGIEIRRNRRQILIQHIQNSERQDQQQKKISNFEFKGNQIASIQQKDDKEKQQTYTTYGEEFGQFRKLRKIAIVLAQKKKERQRGIQVARQYIESEAEEGSDNQDHDDQIKAIDRKAEEAEWAGIDLDGELAELIDNAVDLKEQDEFQAFQKYLQDVRVQDREEIKKIIRGEFRRKHQDLEFEEQEDQKRRRERQEEVIEWMRRREEQEGDGLYVQAENESNSESYQKQKSDQNQDGVPDIPAEEQIAKLERFFEEALPTLKRERQQKTVFFDLGPLPQSLKRQKSSTRISVSKFGGWRGDQIRGESSKIKKTSSFVNQTLNRTTNSSKGVSKIMPIKLGHRTVGTSK